MAKGQPSGGGGFGGNVPPWLGMASMYGGGGFGGYGGGYGGYGGYGRMQGAQGTQGMSGQTGQMGGPPMVADFSQGAGLYQANQAAPYYAGGQPPPPPGTPPSGATPAVGTLPQTGAPTTGLLGGTPDNASGTAFSGLLNSTPGTMQGVPGTMQGTTLPGQAQPVQNGQPGQPDWSQWHNRGYGMPVQPGGGSSGGVMSPGQYPYSLAGLFGGGGGGMWGGRPTWQGSPYTG
jgi:hypothetical protein